MLKYYLVTYVMSGSMLPSMMAFAAESEDNIILFCFKRKYSILFMKETTEHVYNSVELWDRLPV